MGTEARFYMSIATRLSGSLLIVLTASCAPAVQSTSFLSPALPPQPADHPIRFYAETRPQCPYEEIGRVSSRKRSSLVSMDKVMESLRERARQMGGDAIIGIGEHTETRGASIVGSQVVANNDPVFAGTVIRFKDSTCTK